MPVSADQISNLPLFAGMDSVEMEEIAASLEEVMESAGTTLINEGEEPGPLRVLLAGTAEVVKRGIDGRNHVLTTLTAPSVFGEVEILARRPSIAGVVATADVRLGLLRRGVFDELCEANRPCILKLTRNLAATLAGRLAAADHRLATQNQAAPAPGANRMRSILYPDR